MKNHQYHIIMAWLALLACQNETDLTWKWIFRGFIIFDALTGGFSLYAGN